MTAGHDRTVKLWNPHKSSPQPDAVGGAVGKPRKRGAVKQALLIKSYDGVHSHAVHDLTMYVGAPRFAPREVLLTMVPAAAAPTTMPNSRLAAVTRVLSCGT